MLFWKRNKSAEAIRKAKKEVTHLDSTISGSSRRALSLIPVAADKSAHEIAQTSTVRFHQLLITLEGNERTGCLKVISPSKKARSAILIYRGRVVGCLYGRKNLDYQFLHKDAHTQALSDLASPGNVLDAYQLPEELVLAASSMFYGQILDCRSSISALEDFNQAARAMQESRLPGCIVANNLMGELLCMTYFYNGKIVGFFSPSQGWLPPTNEQALAFINSRPVAKVMASLLVLDNNDPATVGFSLTGLDGDNRKRWLQPQLQAIDSFTTVEQARRAQAQGIQAQVEQASFEHAERGYSRPPHRQTATFGKIDRPARSRVATRIPEHLQPIRGTHVPTFAIAP